MQIKKYYQKGIIIFSGAECHEHWLWKNRLHLERGDSLLSFSSLLQFTGEANSGKESPGGWSLISEAGGRIQSDNLGSGKSHEFPEPWLKLWKWGPATPETTGPLRTCNNIVQVTLSPGADPGSNAQFEPSPLLHLQAAKFRQQSLRLAAHQGRGCGCESQSFLKERWSSLKWAQPTGKAIWQLVESHTQKCSYPLNQKFHFWELILKK